MEKEELEAHRSRAWTLAVITWLAGSSVLFGISECISSIRSRDTRELLDMALSAASFFYILALGMMQNRYLSWLCQRSDRAKSGRIE